MHYILTLPSIFSMWDFGKPSACDLGLIFIHLSVLFLLYLNLHVDFNDDSVIQCDCFMRSFGTIAHITTNIYMFSLDWYLHITTSFLVEFYWRRSWFYLKNQCHKVLLLPSLCYSRVKATYLHNIIKPISLQLAK